jgi:hypothetical protein
MSKPVPMMRTRRQRAAGVVRVAAFGFVVSLIGMVVAGRHVYAAYAEGALRVGHELDGFGDTLSNAKTVYLNGAAMNVSTAFTDQSPKEVLDRFQALCEGHPSFLSRAMMDIPATLHDPKTDGLRARGLRLTVVRKDVDGEGALSCFTDDRPSGLRGLQDRIRAFARSKDLSEFGRFRYVYARSTPHGTHVRTIWTDGAMNLGEMFPARGDAAGSDSRIVPRPPDAKRILSAGSAEVPYGVHMYDSPASFEATAAFYEGELTARGWKHAGDVRDGGPQTTVYLKDGGLIYITLSRKEARTLVTITEAAQSENGTGRDIASVRVEN